MKKLLFLFLVSFCLSAGCDKTVDKKVEDLVIQMMTTGQWSITLFKVDTVDRTSEFAGYRFQYYKNLTVDAFYNSILQKSGTWSGNAETMTTTANFPNSTEPISLINGNWLITKSGSRVVEATQTNGTEVKLMRLYRE